VRAGATAVSVAFHPHYQPRHHLGRRLARSAFRLIGRHDFSDQVAAVRIEVALVEQPDCKTLRNLCTARAGGAGHGGW
jgi:ribosomal protein S18 acetylase RimI-like enzyme